MYLKFLFRGKNGWLSICKRKGTTKKTVYKRKEERMWIMVHLLHGASTRKIHLWSKCTATLAVWTSTLPIWKTLEKVLHELLACISYKRRETNVERERVSGVRFTSTCQRVCLDFIITVAVDDDDQHRRPAIQVDYLPILHLSRPTFSSSEYLVFIAANGAMCPRISLSLLTCLLISSDRRYVYIYIYPTINSPLARRVCFCGLGGINSTRR